MILYVEYPKESIRNFLEIISKFSKVAGYMINRQKPTVLLYTCKEQSKNEIKKTIPFIIAPKRIKCLGINLTKEMRILY